MNTDGFKFRVWDTKDKEYLDPEYYEEFAITPDGVIRVGLTVDNGICDEFQSIPPESLIVERCTGLRDRNGKLIYKGDVLYHSSCGRREVCFSIDTASFMLRSLSPIPVKGMEDIYMTWYFCREIISDFCIIGNIHDEEQKQ